MSGRELERVEVLGRVASKGLKSKDAGGHAAAELPAGKAMVGTTISVQQRLMRHSDIQTTMNTYGEVVTDEMQPAGSKARISHSIMIPK